MQFNSKIDGLKSYEAGKPIELVVREFGIKAEDVIKLASNENPRGCSPSVVLAMQEELKNMSMYPDDSMFELKEALSKNYNVETKNIIIGSGSDQVIEFILHAKANKNTKVLMSGITFAMYEIYSKQVEASIIRTKSNKHDLNEFLDAYQQNKDIKIIFLCIPNNPLGECVGKEDVFNFISKIDKDTLVVIDCAYMEFASYKDKNKHIEPKELIETFSNVIYLGTFSKAYGLGGMRIGYGIASKEIIGALAKLRPPFNITTLSLKAATLALEDKKFVQDTLKLNFEEMARYEDLAKELKIEYIDSYTNFITYILQERNSSEIASVLLKKGVIIRDLASYGINAIRITIGTKEQNSTVIKALKSFYM